MSFELTTIGQYASVQGGYAFKSPDFLSNGFRPVLKIKNVRHGYVDYNDVAYVSEDIATSCIKWETHDGDILISMTGSGPSAPESLVGRVARVSSSEPKALINQRVGRLILKDEHAIDKDFLFYVLSQKETQEYLVSNSTGSANQVNINGKTIESVYCPKVTFEESTQIASVLRALDKQVRLLRETNATLEAIAQALFKSWFVDFDPVHANAGTQAPSLPPEIQALFPATFTDSPQGLAPEGWEWSTIAESFILTMGQSPPGDTYNETGEGLPFYQGRTDYGFRFPTQRVFCTAPTRLAQRGDSLVSVRAPVGDVNIALENCALGRGVAGVRHPRDCNSFVFYALKLLKPHFEHFNGEGTVFGSINKKDFQNLPVIAPKKPVLDAFEAVTSSIDAQIENNEIQLRTLISLRDTLLPRLISGQLRLPETEQAIAAIRD